MPEVRHLPSLPGGGEGGVAVNKRTSPAPPDLYCRTRKRAASTATPARTQLIGRWCSPQRRRHGPESGSVWAVSVTRWRSSVRAVRRVGQPRGGRGRRPVDPRSTHTRGQWARSRDKRVRPSESSRPSLFARPAVPSVTRPAVGLSWGTNRRSNRARSTPRRSRRRRSRGTDSDGALTDHGATARPLTLARWGTDDSDGAATGAGGY